jgi:hypothetical protein
MKCIDCGVELTDANTYVAGRLRNGQPRARGPRCKAHNLARRKATRGQNKRWNGPRFIRDASGEVVRVGR